MNRRASVAAACILFLMACACAAAAEDRTPAPYTPDEFPKWARDMWRAEAVFVGSFPFTLFASLELYDTVRYASNGFSPSYAPWPLGSTANSYSGEETLWIVFSAISLSMVISGIDYLLGRVNEQSSRR